MSKLKILTKKNKRAAIFWTGTLLLITGAALWLYTGSVIQNHEQLLKNPDLTSEERWRYEGSLQWWRTAKTATYDPLSIVLITIGVVAIEYTFLHAIYMG